MCGQFGVRVPEVVAELLSLASSAQVEESPSEDEGQENDYDLSDQVSYVASVYDSEIRAGCCFFTTDALQDDYDDDNYDATRIVRGRL